MEQEEMKEQSSGKLLDPGQRASCESIAIGEAPYSQRAQALLALDEGATQKEAAGRSGLTAGQVKYWLGRFREYRMAIFPEALLEQTEPAMESPEQMPGPDEAERDQTTTDESADEEGAAVVTKKGVGSKKKSKKKSAQGKGSKKGNKNKKGKKKQPKRSKKKGQSKKAKRSKKPQKGKKSKTKSGKKTKKKS